ncbi:hypothetical protein [Actinoplanes utahensis]|uniref:hypothetical protein n=1 Tax=Actinoplanes utahensis TaxID=1869 RepID=UPI000690FB8A|nr:hypothetical protein [Actinoplanes utahensis]GIF35158.1 hypothetical protein Aut01nite_81440 [Actinoplanes utahensis]
MGIEEDLAVAGLTVLGEYNGSGTLVPALLTGQAPSCPAEERWSESTLDTTDPQLVEKANADWYRMSIEAGLFLATDRRFLLAHQAGEDEPSRWICVELQNPWDIVGKGAAGTLGSRSGCPEFRMLAMDGSVLACGTTNQTTIDIFLVKDPNRSEIFRLFASGLVSDEYLHPEDAAKIRDWLDYVEG